MNVAPVLFHHTAAKFLLSEREAIELISHYLETVHMSWKAICDEVELSEVERKLFWGRMFSLRSFLKVPRNDYKISSVTVSACPTPRFSTR